MALKRAMIWSSIAHAVMFMVLIGSKALFMPTAKALLPMETHLVMKKARPDLLPKKPKLIPPKVSEQPQARPQEKELIALPRPSEVKEKPVKDNARLKTLSSLSQDFMRDIQAQEETIPQDPEEVVMDQSYFIELHALLKSSFVIPPHLNGPKGKKLKTTVRIFLAPNGDLLKLELEQASFDDGFDQAVLAGIRRVSSFGVVPIFLRDSLKNQGVVVDLCPFTCADE